MAYTDKTRFGEYMQKKQYCLFANPVRFGSENEDIATVSDNYLMALLPPHALITSAYVRVNTASDAVTSATVALGTTEGGEEIMAAVDITTTGKKGNLPATIDTGTGVDLYMAVDLVGAATEVGEFIIVVEYIEYEKNTGEYTEISRFA